MGYSWIRTEVEEALRRIDGYVEKTPLVPSSWLSGMTGAEVFCKLENFQHTGSFKFRGALNKVLSLGTDSLKRGIVTASTGNHALAVARSLRITGSPGVIFVPENIETSKLLKIEEYGVDVRKFGTDNVDTEIHARAVAMDGGMTYISPYNDPMVIGGQGTIGAEIESVLPRADAVFASVGGGGLISGIAGYLKSGGRSPLIT
ncbi:MAG TPA: pyridoxal-phosphate dependent enzyme, partial [Candidatus Krumholzibacterium sp.]|nr:pyridoxal-phosphate dependent enzyme [Candidatus Krumholzibacterium sp.]